MKHLDRNESYVCLFWELQLIESYVFLFLKITIDRYKYISTLLLNFQNFYFLSYAGRHPHWHLPAANALRPNHFHASHYNSCLRLISIYKINHSNLRPRLIPSVVPSPGISRATLGDVNQAVSESLPCVPSPAVRRTSSPASPSRGPRTSPTTRRQFSS